MIRYDPERKAFDVVRADTNHGKHPGLCPHGPAGERSLQVVIKH